MKTISNFVYAILLGAVVAHQGEGIDPNHKHEIIFGSSTVTPLGFPTSFDPKHKSVDIYLHGHQ